MLGRTGEPFWRRESYDHWVRNDDEWRRIAAYIENNPVKAGLASLARTSFGQNALADCCDLS
jgi:putative transposase